MKLSELNVIPEIQASDTLLVIDVTGNASRVPFGNLTQAIINSEALRNGLVESLVTSDYFNNMSKATVIANLESLGELPENSTAAFLDFLTRAQTAGDGIPDVQGVLSEQTVTVGPNVTLVVEGE
jgi:hypothetical protein